MAARMSEQPEEIVAVLRIDGDGAYGTLEVAGFATEPAAAELAMVFCDGVRQVVPGAEVSAVVERRQLERFSPYQLESRMVAALSKLVPDLSPKELVRAARQLLTTVFGDGE